jgi:hypothetical protein
MLALTALAAATLSTAATTPPAMPPQPSSATPTNSSNTSTEIEGVTVIAPKLNLMPPWTDKLNLDPVGTFATPDAPYLRRRPTDGCKMMAGGTTDPMGKSGAASGVVCVKRF